MDVVKSYNALKEARKNLESYWADAYRYSFPNRGLKFISESSPVTAQNYQASLFDTTAADSCRLLASSMLSGLTPPNSQWFNLHIPVHESHELKSWLDRASKIIYQMIHSSNYDSEAFEFFLDIVIGGQAGLYIEMTEDFEFEFEFWSLYDLYCMSTKGKRIDTVYRQLSYTAQRAINMFGEENVPEAVMNEYKNNQDSQKMFSFIHCIKPNEMYDPDRELPDAKNFMFTSIYVCEKTKKVVKHSGYHEFPVVIPRWFQIPGTEYAVGPLDAALPDVKTLNKIVQLMLTNGEIQIAPPLIAKRDGLLNPNNVILGARKVIFAQDPNNLKPLQTGSDFNWANAEIMRLQNQIRKVMMADQLSPQGNVQMTATEISVRVKLIRQLLGPIYGRFQAEFLQPLIERCFGLALRAGILGDQHSNLENFDVHPQYLSPLARAQRQEDLTAITTFESLLAQSAQIDPNILDLYDADKATLMKGDLLGVPVDLIRDEFDIKKIRKHRQEQQMMAEQANGE